MRLHREEQKPPQGSIPIRTTSRLWPYQTEATGFFLIHLPHQTEQKVCLNHLHVPEQLLNKYSWNGLKGVLEIAQCHECT